MGVAATTKASTRLTAVSRRSASIRSEAGYGTNCAAAISSPVTASSQRAGRRAATVYRAIMGASQM